MNNDDGDIDHKNINNSTRRKVRADISFIEGMLMTMILVLIVMMRYIDRTLITMTWMTTIRRPEES